MVHAFQQPRFRWTFSNDVVKCSTRKDIPESISKGHVTLLEWIAFFFCFLTERTGISPPIFTFHNCNHSYIISWENYLRMQMQRLYGQLNILKRKFIFQWISSFDALHAVQAHILSRALQRKINRFWMQLLCICPIWHTNLLQLSKRLSLHLMVILKVQKQKWNCQICTLKKTSPGTK